MPFTLSSEAQAVIGKDLYKRMQTITRIDTNQINVQILTVCPFCSNTVVADNKALICDNCGRSFNINEVE